MHSGELSWLLSLQDRDKVGDIRIRFLRDKFNLTLSYLKLLRLLAVTLLTEL